MMMKHRLFLLCASLLLAALSGCAPEDTVMHDGYYSARADSFGEDGWKEFLTLYVHNNRIITVEYNARNASGLVMSWDVLYLSRLKAAMGIHPNQIIREYANELLNRQNPANIRRIKRDTRFYDSFITLAAGATAQAKAGDKTVIEIPVNGSGPNFRGDGFGRIERDKNNIAK